MKRQFLIIVGLSALFSSWSWADPLPTGAPVPINASTSTSTTSVTVATTTYIPNFADFGETVSTPTPNAMTQPPKPTLYTLTRTVLPIRQAPANVSEIYPDQTIAFDAQNAAEMLSHATGILFQPQGGAYPLNASIRGGSGAETLVLIDGRPMEGPALGPADLTEIPTEQIDHIEIIRGGLSSLYGANAMGGVINIITKRAAYTGYPLSHVSYEDAKYGRQIYRLDYGSRQGPVDYFFFANQEWESGFRNNSDERLYNIGGNAGLDLGKKGKVLVDVSSYHNNFGLPGFRCDNTLDATCANGTDTTPLEPNRFDNKDETYALTPYAREITDSNYLRTSYLVQLSTKVYMATRLFGNDREAAYNDAFDAIPALVANTDRHEHTTGGDLQFNLPMGLVVGGSFIHDQENYLDLINSQNSFNASEDNWGFFAEETWRWNSLTLIPSGRYDENSQFGHTANPRLQGLFDATDWLKFSSSAGRSFRVPTFDEMAPMPTFNDVGNPNLLPETAWNYDAGFELYESSKSLKVNFYRANIENTIQTMVPEDPNNPASPLTSVNLDRSFRQGAEIEISHVVNSKFKDSWNYTYLENRGTPSGFTQLVPLAYSPRHTANYTATYLFKPKWKIEPTVRYESSRYSGNDQGGTEMGAQVIFDARLAYEWRQAELFFGINDITGKRYEEVPGYPLPGRTIYTGLRLRLWG